MEHYKVRTGDTLSKIAKRYGVTVNALQKANPIIKDINKISVGWNLAIPPKHSYEEIGRAVEQALNEIGELKSVKKLSELLGD